MNILRDNMNDIKFMVANIVQQNFETIEIIYTEVENIVNSTNMPHIFDHIMENFELTMVLSMFSTIAIIMFFNWAVHKIFYSKIEKEKELGKIQKKKKRKFTLKDIQEARSQCQAILLMYERKEIFQQSAKIIIQNMHLENHQIKLKEAFKLLKSEVKNLKKNKDNSATKNKEKKMLEEDDVVAQTSKMKLHEKAYLHKLFTTLDKKYCNQNVDLTYLISNYKVVMF